MNRIYKLFVVIFLLLGLNSCYKDVSTTYDEMDVTLTLFDKEFSERTDTNFQTYKTFVIRDSVGLISDYIDQGSSDWTNFYKPNGTSDEIRKAIKQKFIDKGYVQVDSLKKADFAVNLVVTLVQNDVYVGNPGYWYGYPGYYPYWGWGFYWKSGELKTSENMDYYYYDPWYGYYPWYGYGYSYSYEKANIMIEMIDGRSLVKYYEFLDEHQNDDNIAPEDYPIIYYRWQSFLNGVVADDATYGKDRFDRSVEEAFTQSPYIYSSNN